jgi:hypothetical protein
VFSMSCLPLSSFAHWCCFPPATPTGRSFSRCPSRAFPIQISHVTHVCCILSALTSAHTLAYGRRAAAKQRKAYSARHPRYRSPKRRHKIAKGDHRGRRRRRRRRLHRSTTVAALLTFFTEKGEGQGVMRCMGGTLGTVRRGALACCARECARLRHALSVTLACLLSLTRLGTLAKVILLGHPHLFSITRLHNDLSRLALLPSLHNSHSVCASDTMLASRFNLNVVRRTCSGSSTARATTDCHEREAASLGHTACDRTEVGSSPSHSSSLLNHVTFAAIFTAQRRDVHTLSVSRT